MDNAAGLIGEYLLEVDPGASTAHITVYQTSSKPLYIELPFGEDGSPTTNPVGTIQAVTTNPREPGIAGCPLTDNCFTVELTNFTGVSQFDVFMTVDQILPPTGRGLVGSDPIPPGVPATEGRSFGDLNVGQASGSQAFDISIPDLTSYVVQGRFFGDTGDFNVFPMSLGAPIAGTLASFEFNGDTSDTSGNGNNGFARDPVPAYEATSFGQGLRGHDVGSDQEGLDWTGPWLTNFVHPFTAELVIILNNDTTWRKIFSHDDSSDNGWYFNDGNDFRDYPGGTAGNQQFTIGRHYLVVRSTSNLTADIFQNGVQLPGIPLGRDWAVGPGSAIFLQDDAATGRGEGLDGVLDAMRISTVTRTQAEIDAIQARLAANP